MLAGKKGRKIRIAGVVFFLVLVPLFILAYVTIRFINTVSGGGGQTLFDIAYLMVGVWGLLLTVYLLPIARGDFITFEKMSDLATNLRKVKSGEGSTVSKIESKASIIAKSRGSRNNPKSRKPWTKSRRLLPWSTQESTLTLSTR